ncbi:MAG: hypothetical protein HYS55_00850 [Candidatus Omnitrophica bacterium]|nr:hypothetical protein [Candidatus Omnitrophota bacterium]
MKRNRKKTNKMVRLGNKKGILLVATLGFIASVTVLSAAFLTASMVQIRAAENFEHRVVAFHWTEGAIDQTIVALKSNPSYSGVPSTTENSCDANGYHCRVTGNYSTTVTSLGNSAYRILANGSINGTSLVLPQSRSIETYVSLASQSPFSMALFANQTIAMSGNAQTDAYDSSVGTYNVGTATSEGHIGSNRSGGNTIALSGNVQIKGDATVGPGADINTAIVTSGNATITGTESVASSTTTLDPVTVPGSATNLGSISVSGNNTQTLTGGTYVVSSISVTGNGRLNVTGNATIYVTGNVNIAGNGVGTASNLPTNLTLKVQGSQINLSGNGAFYGGIYAPSTQVNISGNGALYGAVVANWINDSGNGNVHYDKALNQAGGGSSNNQMTYWAEL